MGAGCEESAKSMLDNIIKAFVVLALLFFVMLHPEKPVEFLKMFVDAAYAMGDALGNLSLNGGA